MLNFDLTRCIHTRNVTHTGMIMIGYGVWVLKRASRRTEAHNLDVSCEIVL